MKSKRERNKYFAEYRAKNREKLRQYNKEYMESLPPEKIEMYAETRRQYALTHADKIKKYQERYRMKKKLERLNKK